jgi:hypothetical protein
MMPRALRLAQQGDGREARVRRGLSLILERSSAYAFLRLFLLLPIATALLGCGSDQSKGQAWVGKTFLLDTPAISNSHWKKPVALGQVLINYAPQFLFAVAAGADDNFAVTIGTAQEYVQDPCTPIQQATTPRADYPNSTISVPALPMHIVSRDPSHPDPSQATIHDVVFKDVLPGLPNAATAQMNFTVEVAMLCPAMDQAGVPCEVCPWNGERVCQMVEVVEVVAQEAAVPLEPISASEVPAACS